VLLCFGQLDIKLGLQTLEAQYPRKFTSTRGSGFHILHPGGRTNFRLAQAAEPPGQKPKVVNGVDVGPFEEKEEGIGIASDVAKAEDEDLATPGLGWVFETQEKKKEHEKCVRVRVFS